MQLTYVVSYFLVVITCLAVTAAIATKLTRDVGSQSEMRIFRDAIYGYMVFLLTNGIWIWCNNGYLPSSWNYVLSAVNISALSVCSFFLFQYAEQKLQSPLYQSKCFRCLSPMPMCITVFFAFASPFTGWLFYYTEDNKYTHGPFYALQLIMYLLYFLFIAVHAFIVLRRTKNATKKKEFLTFIIFVFCPFCAGIIDKLIPDLPVLELSMLFSVFIVFANLQESQIYRDALTGLNNRRLADERLVNKISQASELRPFYFFIADINSFKHINDTYGHMEGDNALIIIAKTFQEIGRTYHSFIARWGGDEFIIIAEARHIPEPEQFISAIGNILSEKSIKLRLPYELKLSIGYAKCASPDENAYALISKADDMLYEDKKEYYRTLNRRGRQTRRRRRFD